MSISTEFDPVKKRIYILNHQSTRVMKSTWFISRYCPFKEPHTYSLTLSECIFLPPLVSTSARVKGQRVSNNYVRKCVMCQYNHTFLFYYWQKVVINSFIFFKHADLNFLAGLSNGIEKATPSLYPPGSKCKLHLNSNSQRDRKFIFIWAWFWTFLKSLLFSLPMCLP